MKIIKNEQKREDLSKSIKEIVQDLKKDFFRPQDKLAKKTDN